MAHAFAESTRLWPYCGLARNKDTLRCGNRSALVDPEVAGAKAGMLSDVSYAHAPQCTSKVQAHRIQLHEEDTNVRTDLAVCPRRTTLNG